MIETGKVIKIEDEKAVVLFELSEQCSKCKICLFDETGQRILKVANDINAVAGDRVEIVIPEGAISKLSFSVFILPIINFFIGYFFAWIFSRSEAVSVISGVIIFLLTFYALFIYEKKMNQIKKDTLPYILKILGEKDSDKLNGK